MGKLKHGLWIGPSSFKQMDGRLRIAKAFKAVRGELETALGGDLSPQQSILVDRVVYLLYRVKTFEAILFNGDGTSHDVDSYYLAWVNSLRRILETLGLKRIPHEIDIGKAVMESHAQAEDGRKDQ